MKTTKDQINDALKDAGGATTLLAAAIEGRRAIGAEVDLETYEAAKARIAKGYTPDMFSKDGWCGNDDESMLGQRR